MCACVQVCGTHGLTCVHGASPYIKLASRIRSSLVVEHLQTYITSQLRVFIRQILLLSYRALSDQIVLASSLVYFLAAGGAECEYMFSS